MSQTTADRHWALYKRHNRNWVLSITFEDFQRAFEDGRSNGLNEDESWTAYKRDMKSKFRYVCREDHYRRAYRYGSEAQGAR